MLLIDQEALENRIKRFETLSRLSNEDIDSVNGMALLYELTTGDEVVKGTTKDAKIRVKEEIEAQWTNYLKQKEAWDLISADNIISRIAEIKKNMLMLISNELQMARSLSLVEIKSMLLSIKSLEMS